MAESAPTPAEFRLLGPVEAIVDDRAVELGGPRQRTLLALLLLEPGRPVPSERLAEELWRGRPPPGATTTLYSYVSRLRRALGRDAVVAGAGGYLLAVEPERLDARRFERLLAEGREALGRGAAGIAAERLEAALALWRGRALADVADGAPALASEARRLDELRLDAAEERVEAALALGRHDALVPELRALVDAEPLRERRWQQLVLALYRSGRQAEALESYREARRILQDELGLEPGEELREVERAVLRQEIVPVAPVEARHNLPAPTTSFVGREDELTALERLLREHRLVTLTGTGGAGKTRLALEAARRQTAAWSGGVWLVDLTAIADPELVPGAVATTLGAFEPSLDALLTHARGLELLLVLDNCEHLVDTCAELAGTLLAACPNLRILATSRVPLAVAGEVDVALDPLPLPREDAAGPELARSPAVQLFLDRARAVRRDLPADAPALAWAAGICRDLDGLPLALELAAARARALSLAEIAARLDDRFRFLRAWQRVADPRHRTLETAMDWSYELLEEDERTLLRRLSVFAGGADLETVAAVCLAGDGASALELLERLVDASLVRAETGEPTRYRLLETVREYGAAKLAADPAAGTIRRRHAEHFLAVAESANLSFDAVGRGPQRQEVVVAEQHNIRAALDWAAEEDVELGLRLALALENFWVTQAPPEGGRRFEELLARAGDVELGLRAAAERDRAAFRDIAEDFVAARAGYERSRELFRRVGDEANVAHVDFRLALMTHLHDGDVDAARAGYEACLAVFERAGDEVGLVQCLGNLGGIERDHGDPERGIAMLEHSLELARSLGWLWWEARGLEGLAIWALENGRLEEAERRSREFLEIGLRTRGRQDVVHALALLARSAAARGEDERALALWATVDAVEDMPGRFGQFDRAAYAAHLPSGPLPEPLPLDEAVALALST